MKKVIYIIALFVTFLIAQSSAKGQALYIGINGGVSSSWFQTPKFENILTSTGLGWDVGFFLRYGKRTFLQLGFNWTRTNNSLTLNDSTGEQYTDIRLNNFDFSTKLGYEIVHTPMFKLKVAAGPYIGTTFFLSTEDLIFSKNDFVNPQFGFIAETGIQFMNFILDFDYNYHFSQLFKPVPVENEMVKIGAHMQIMQIKVGFMF